MNDFKIGEDVVCVNFGGNDWITEGNTYSVLDVSQTQILIKNKNNSKVWYQKKLFTKVEQASNENWKPKVGEPCISNDLWGNPEITPKFVGDDFVLFNLFEREYAFRLNSFSPLKTTAEIEQDRIIDKALELLGHSRGDFTIVSILKQLYRANLFSDKQVKPLSDELVNVLNFLLGIESINGYDFGEVPEGKKSFWWREHLREALKPYTIQGGDK